MTTHRILAVVNIEPAPLFEVIRQHSDSGRVQLVYWNRTSDEADLLTYTHNHDFDDQGRALVASGLHEHGWRYEARVQGPPTTPPAATPPHTNGVSPRARRRRPTGGRA